jgi:DNA adenine methylase
MIPSVTPLRYPGSKTWLVEYISKFLEFNNLEPELIAEPYAGSGAVAVSLLLEGKVKKALLNENDPMIVAFWKSILYHPDELIERIESTEINLATWNKFRKYLEADAPKKYPTMDLGFAFFFFNRTNFSGIVTGGPLGGKSQQSRYSLACRFKKDYLIEKVRKIGDLRGKIKIYHGDGIRFMRKIQKDACDHEVIYYVDPPYFRSGRDLYRRWFTEEDHIELAEFLKSFDSPWLLSYDDSEFIKLLYTESKSQPIYADYQAWRYKRDVKELLFSNNVIPPMIPGTEDAPVEIRVNTE